MLVLTRKEGEQIHIGNDITVTVTLVQGDRVRLGIEAPRDVTILRGELVVDPNQKTSEVVKPEVVRKEVTVAVRPRLQYG